MSIIPRTGLAALLAVGLATAVVAQPVPPAKAPADDAAPMSGRAIETTIETQLKIAERPETAARVATYKRNLYEALLKKGFTGDQAMQITIATPLPPVYANR